MKHRFTAKRNSGAPTTPGTQAVARALDVLATLAGMPGEQSLAALADATAIDKATLLRLLVPLEASGFVARPAGRPAYHLGPTLIRLGVLARRATGLHDAARPALAALAGATGEAATLEVLAGGETLIIDEAHGHFLVGVAPEAGTRWPAHATSTGKMLLAAVKHGASAAGGDPADWRRDLPKRLARRTPHTITTHAALERELDATWARGYAVGAEELEPGFVAIGAPVFDADGLVVAAVGVGGPASRLTRARIPATAAHVRDAAATISATLGAPRAPR